MTQFLPRKQMIVAELQVRGFAMTIRVRDVVVSR